MKVNFVNNKSWSNFVEVYFFVCATVSVILTYDFEKEMKICIYAIAGVSLIAFFIITSIINQNNGVVSKNLCNAVILNKQLKYEIVNYNINEKYSDEIIKCKSMTKYSIIYSLVAILLLFLSFLFIKNHFNFSLSKQHGKIQ